ncbi:hypothetical protein C8R45DRAFT_1029410 [Mycena sanguinolenta]|nr:hypothetical protein C8R45DRAFT_1029410 [Mycena sanguinolenta]
MDTVVPAQFILSVNAAAAARNTIQRHAHGVLQPGHYYLFLETPGGPLGRVVPEFKVNEITSRTVTRGTGTRTQQNGGHNRSAVVRADVRRRDGRCRVTGQAAPFRERGINYKGLQVAHIYPLGWWHKAATYLDPAVRTVLNHHGASGDVVQNALLMKSDVHDQFDDYQFGFWLDAQLQPPAHVLYRFEATGAPSVITGILMYNTLFATNVPAPLPPLFLQHFKTALHWHVKAFGRKNGH